MVDRGVLARRLRALEELETRLDAFVAIPEADFIADPSKHALAERFLHLSVECVIDIGNQLLADRCVPAPDTYRDVFILLAKEGVISAELAGRLASWASFRNVLVHMYLDIDHRISWRTIQYERGDLTEFRRIVAALL